MSRTHLAKDQGDRKLQNLNQRKRKTEFDPCRCNKPKAFSLLQQILCATLSILKSDKQAHQTISKPCE